MRRPNLKWLLKSIFLLLVSGTLFFTLTSWLSASPYTNRLPALRSPEAFYKVPEGKLHVPVQSQHEKLPPPPPQPAPHQEELIEKPNVEDDRREDQNGDQLNQLQLLSPAGAKKDWHDYTAMERDAKRIGIGEQGQRAELNDESQRELEKKMSLENGFNALLSDSISVNRSIADIRYKGCKTKQYLANLPTVSIVIPFFNEHFSVLVRSVHSLVNRSPPELLKEIILVDDFSDREYLFQQLEQYVAENFPKVQIVRLEKRSGLIGARMAGARKATAQVLIFLDSHVEANYNWLPPLLEPIALNKRTSVCPFIDVIDHSNFQYRAQDEGARGAFDWEFYYKRLPLLPEDLVDRSKPFRSPVMAGGLFAISSEFFWELGGYDEGLDIWGGEQYELSFKIWMCGGELLDAPCSRVGHIYRGPRNHSPSPRNGDYLHRNYKRVAEVWMDEYKNYLYERGQGVYEGIDAGNLTIQKGIRNKLHCKSFKWFMENVAFDLTKVYPPVEPPDYAYGAIQSLGAENLCIDTIGVKEPLEIGLDECIKDLNNFKHNQNWVLNWHRDIRKRNKDFCMDSVGFSPNSSVEFWRCHGKGGNQFWYYDHIKKWLIQGYKGNRCLEAVPIERKVVVNNCQKDNINMKWNFDVVNRTALDGFLKGI